MIYLANTFTLSMLEAPQGTVKYQEISLAELKTLLTSNQWQSCIGHESTAKLLSALLGMEIPQNRIAIKARRGDIILVVQVMVRLEEGKVLNEHEIFTLFERGQIKFFKVEIYA